MDAPKKRQALPSIDKAQGASILQLPKIQRYLDMLVEGEDAKAAALACGIRVKRAQTLMHNTAFRTAFFKRCDVLKMQERARNIRAMVETRDLAFDPEATAAERKTALEAVRMLEGEDKGSSITINGGQNVIGGYVIRLDGPSEGPKAIGNRIADEAKPLELQAVVTDEDR